MPTNEVNALQFLLEKVLEDVPYPQKQLRMAINNAKEALGLPFTSEDEE